MSADLLDWERAVLLERQRALYAQPTQDLAKRYREHADVYRPDREAISKDPDPLRRVRRRRRVEADLALRLTGEPCQGCGERAWSDGGEGCQCPPGVSNAGRCLRLAAEAAADRDSTWWQA